MATNTATLLLMCVGSRTSKPLGTLREFGISGRDVLNNTAFVSAASTHPPTLHHLSVPFQYAIFAGT